MGSAFSAIESTIRKYNLLDPSEDVLVAFSGGKDSIALSLCLRELGYSVLPVAIDMGYEGGWAERIQGLCEAIGFHAEVIPVRAGLSQRMPELEAQKIQLRLEVLNSISPDRASTLTPCTHCYNSKVIVLDNVARAHGVTSLAFAHHHTDACASLLKEALLRIDRLDRKHNSYSRRSFEGLVTELATEAQSDFADTPVLDRITELVRDGLVDTDEPPRQPLRSDRHGVDVVRPLFELWENDVAAVTLRAGVTPEGSGCGHVATRNTETPREMVHYRVLRNATPRFRTRLSMLVLQGIDVAGRAVRRSRYRRLEDLGPDYKAMPPISDKL
jgi:hypothetical protein